jgi:hypothetical protein
MTEAEDRAKIICQAWDKIQSDLVFDTLLFYAKKDYPAFWRAMDLFLRVKEKHPCSISPK